MTEINALFERMPRQVILLLFYCLCSLIIGLLSIWIYVGLSSDSMTYIVGGISIANLGQYDLRVASVRSMESWTSITAFPPFYSLTIAMLILMGFDSTFAGRLIPVIAYSATIFPLFFLTKRVSSSSFAHLCCLTWVVFGAGIRCASYAWSETPFVFLVVLSFFLLSRDIDTSEGESRRILLYFITGCFLGFATITRWIGAIFTASVITYLMMFHPKQRGSKETLTEASIVAGGWLVPVLPIVIRNYIVSSTFFGHRAASETPITKNAEQALATFKNSFLIYFGSPYVSIILLLFLTISGVSFLLILSKMVQGDSFSSSRVLFHQITKSRVTYSFLLIPVIFYVSFLITWRSIIYFDEITFRLMFPCYPFILIIICKFMKEFSEFVDQEFIVMAPIRSLGRHRQLARRILIVTLFLLILLPQIGQLQTQFGEKKESPGWKDAFSVHSQIKEGVSWIDHNTAKDSVILTNHRGAVFFYTERIAIYLNEYSYTGFVDRLQDIEAGIARHNVSYIVLFRFFIDALDYGHDVNLLAAGENFPSNWEILLLTNQTTIYAV